MSNIVKLFLVAITLMFLSYQTTDTLGAIDDRPLLDSTTIKANYLKPKIKESTELFDSVQNLDKLLDSIQAETRDDLFILKSQQEIIRRQLGIIGD